MSVVRSRLPPRGLTTAASSPMPRTTPGTFFVNLLPSASTRASSPFSESLIAARCPSFFSLQRRFLLRSQRGLQYLVHGLGKDKFHVFLNVARDLFQVLLVPLGDDYRLYPHPLCGKRLFLKPAYRQYPAPQGHLTSHRDILIDRPAGK